MTAIISFSLDEEDVAWLDKEAKRLDRSRSWIVRQMLGQAMTGGTSTAPSASTPTGPPTAARLVPEPSRSASTPPPPKYATRVEDCDHPLYLRAIGGKCQKCGDQR